jgi:ABC-type nitrate/sulfonate/bicarbonate transport system ATPase subunit
MRIRREDVSLASGWSSGLRSRAAFSTGFAAQKTCLAPEQLSRSDSVAAPSKIEARGVSVTYLARRQNVDALRSVTVAAAAGEFVSVIGPSGCGKSTLFEVIAGLQQPTTGAVLLDGVPVPRRLGMIGYMPQKDLLLPWKSVIDNAIIGLELRGVNRRAARQEALKWSDRFGLEGFEQRYPRSLSGGMKQRAALLRTFLAGRETLLLDEPFGALDALTRADMQQWLLDVWHDFDKTILFVTHDVDEAIYLSDRVYVMSRRPGTIRLNLEIPLPRPRFYEATVTSGPFALLKRKILSELRTEFRAQTAL